MTLSWSSVCSVRSQVILVVLTTHPKLCLLFYSNMSAHHQVCVLKKRSQRNAQHDRPFYYNLNLQTHRWSNHLKKCHSYQNRDKWQICWIGHVWDTPVDRILKSNNKLACPMDVFTISFSHLFFVFFPFQASWSCPRDPQRCPSLRTRSLTSRRSSSSSTPGGTAWSR